MRKRTMILVHGTWCTCKIWGDFSEELKKLDINVYTPDLLFHNLPYEECEKKVGNISITRYVQQVIDLADALEEKPILLGHSLGCLIVQLAAVKIQPAAMILCGPAPAWGMFPFYRTVLKTFGKHFLRWGFWYKAMPPYANEIRKYVMNIQTPEDQNWVIQNMVPESGRTYAQMGLWFLDVKQTTRVRYRQIHCPVLIIGGTMDYATVLPYAKKTAKRYPESRLVIFEGADHMYTMGRFMPKTIKEIQKFCIENTLL